MQIKHHDPKVMALMQLETALAVYFQGKDLYSVITLAGAADESFVSSSTGESISLV